MASWKAHPPARGREICRLGWEDGLESEARHEGDIGTLRSEEKARTRESSTIRLGRSICSKRVVGYSSSWGRQNELLTRSSSMRSHMQEFKWTSHAWSRWRPLSGVFSEDIFLMTDIRSGELYGRVDWSLYLSSELVILVTESRVSNSVFI